MHRVDAGSRFAHVVEGYVGGYFALNVRPCGTVRQHLESVRKSGRVVPGLELLDLPPRPPELHLVLPLFHHLSARRPMEQGVPLPIRDSEIEAYCRIAGLRLSHADLEWLYTLDREWLTAMRTKPEVS